MLSTTLLSKAERTNMLQQAPWKVIENRTGKTIVRGTSRFQAQDQFEQKFGITFCMGNGFSIINDDLAHFEPNKYSGGAKYDWPRHDRILVKCRDYDEYRRAMIVSGVDPAPKGTVQGRRSTFRTAGFRVSSWRRW